MFRLSTSAIISIDDLLSFKLDVMQSEVNNFGSKETKIKLLLFTDVMGNFH